MTKAEEQIAERIRANRNMLNIYGIARTIGVNHSRLRRWLGIEERNGNLSKEEFAKVRTVIRSLKSSL